jgi:predicted glutamine amidotransferase
MCIAIIKPAGIDFPTKEVYQNCFESNPDGAGYAFTNGKSFILRKGFMSLGAFLQALESDLKRFPLAKRIELPFLFHFRIGTHGSKADPKHTHPFPVSNNMKALEGLSLSCSRVAMHNGILSGWGDSTYSKVSNPQSDTMHFISDFVYPLAKAIEPKTFKTSKEAYYLVNQEVAGSRFVVMELDGSFAKWGDWVKDSGLFYSNTNYLYSYADIYDLKEWSYTPKTYSSSYVWPKVTIPVKGRPSSSYSKTYQRSIPSKEAVTLESLMLDLSDYIPEEPTYTELCDALRTIAIVPLSSGAIVTCKNRTIDCSMKDYDYFIDPLEKMLYAWSGFDPYLIYQDDYLSISSDLKLSRVP